MCQSLSQRLLKAYVINVSRGILARRANLSYTTLFHRRKTKKKYQDSSKICH